MGDNMKKLSFGGVIANLLLIPILLLTILLLNASPTFAKSPASWGGVSIDENSISNAPVASSLLSQGPSNPLDVQARKRIREQPFSKLEFIQGRDDNTEGVIITATILRESVQIIQDHNRRDPTFNHTYRVFINLMAFDWDVDGGMGRYIGAVPLVIDYLDVSNAPHSGSTQNKIFQSMYLNNSLGGQLNVFDELYNYSREIKIDGYLDKFPQIKSIKFEPDAKRNFNSSQKDVADWSYMAKQFFEAQLVKYSGSVLVPTMSEERMNMEFRLIFSDKSQAIVLPEPSGEIHVMIEKLVPVEKLDGVQKSLCHISVIRMIVVDELDEQLMSRNFARVDETCFVTHKDNRVDHLQLFKESILSLLRDTARQFGPVIDKKWLKKFGVPANALPKYLNEISDVKNELLQSY